MKRFLLPVIAALFVLPASASDHVETGNQPVPSALTFSEKTKVLTVAARMLDASVAYRGDGTARSTYRCNGQRILLEWRGLVVRKLVHGSVAIEEREAGVRRRFYAQLHAPSFRTSTSGGKSWTTWKSGRCPLFPSHILIEEADGKFTMTAPALAHFTPTPDSAPDSDSGVTNPDRELMPHEKVLAHR